MSRRLYRRVVAALAVASILTLTAVTAWRWSRGDGTGAPQTPRRFIGGSAVPGDEPDVVGPSRSEARARAQRLAPTSPDLAQGALDRIDLGDTPPTGGAAQPRVERRAELLAQLRTMGPVPAVFDRIPDAPSLGDLFAGSAGLTRAEVTAWPPSIADGTTLVLPAGVVRVGADALGRAEPIADVVVTGRGIDETLLVLDAPITAAFDVAGLTFEDLTVLCADDCFLSLAGPALVRLRRCRVIGFDGGDGGSHLIRGNGVALLAEDSRIESGFGRRPGVATLLNTSPTSTDNLGQVVAYPSLAWFERCVFAGPFLGRPEHGTAFLAVPRGATVEFSRCVLTDWPAGDSAISGSGRVRLTGCEVTIAADGGAARSRSLAELNPAWRRPDAGTGR